MRKVEENERKSDTKSREFVKSVMMENKPINDAD
jgi:hypothetical protein